MSNKGVFYPQQKIAVNECMEKLLTTPYVILLALTQSGKTGTLTLLALKSIDENRYEKVFIVSGNTSISLRGQMEQDLYSAIEGYIFNKYNNTLTNEQFQSEKQIFISKIKIYWGTQMKDLTESDNKNILIIHDESHYAQSKNNMPYKYLYEKLGIDSALRGDYIDIIKNECGIVNVSATPFSEITSNQKKKKKKLSNEYDNLKEKGIVYMKPGKGYFGVIEHYKNGNIKFNSNTISEKNKNKIINILKNEKYNNKYCIVRTQKAHKDAEIMQSISKTLNMDYVQLFGGINIDDFDFLKNKPLNKTLVHICGVARMGQVICKDHIGMVYEQSKNPNIDTLLQSLLGRVTGYNKNKDIDIYLSDNRKKDIIEYIKCFDGTLGDKCKYLSFIGPAMNLKKKKKTKNLYAIDLDNQIWKKLVPINITLDMINTYSKKEYIDLRDVGKKNLKKIFKKILNINQNENSLSYLEGLEKGLSGKRNLDEDTYQKRGTKNKFDNAIKQQFPEVDCFTNIISEKKSDEIQPIGFISSKDIGYFYGYTKFYGKMEDIFPEVNKKCNYHYFNVKTEKGEEYLNGGQLITFPIDTYEDANLFEKKLSEFIFRTDPEHATYLPECCSYIRSNYCINDNKSKGIYLSKKCYTKDLINKILDRLKKKCNVIFKMLSVNSNENDEYFRYIYISWIRN